LELKLAQLESHLDQHLAPVYLITGEEPFQIEEALSCIRTKARKSAFLEREVLIAERGFDWTRVGEQNNNLSLFGDKKILELRLPTGKPGTAGATALQAYCEDPPEDVLLLINSGKLEKAALKSKWVQAIGQAGVMMRIWPLTGVELTRWVQSRLRKENLADDRERAEYIASCVEGNMLAAAQEIEKLALLEGSQGNDNWMSDQSKYTVFDLIDSILLGQRKKVIKILSQLQRESFAPNLVLWALAELIRAVIFTASPKRGQTKGIHNVFLYSKRNQLGNHINKFKPMQLNTLLIKCSQIDQMIKGRASGDVWQSFVDVSLKLAR
jgi:DNA polymerase-3 subunit delta